MMEAYGRAVVEERVKPRHLAELAEYVRLEYGPGTGLGYFLAEMANGAPPPRWDVARLLAGVFRTLAKAVRAMVPANGNRTRAKALEPVR